MEYDYIVVGSGAGGGPLAARLALEGHTVLVLEAGGAAEGYHYQVPAFHGHAAEDPEMSWNFYVRHYADAAMQRSDSKYVPEQDGVLYPRAGTLGGCTAHNAMITIVPHNSDWDAIAELTGDSSWKSGKMRSYFERLERCQYVERPGTLPKNPLLALGLRVLRAVGLARSGNEGRHGFDGWLTTCAPDPRLGLRDPQLLDVLISATKTAFLDGTERPELESPEVHLDPNDWIEAQESPEGLCFTPAATHEGRRRSTRDVLRETQAKHPDRLTVLTDALVTRVVLDDEQAATGVEFLEGAALYRASPRSNGTAGVPRVAHARREVIVSAGAFNSPQLLMLSGIGPREELERHAIPVRVELPGVGANLQDRYEMGVVYEMHADFRVLEGCTFVAPGEGEDGDRAFVEWRTGKGLYTSNGVVLGVMKRSSAAGADPDLFVFGLPGYFRGYYPGYSLALEKQHNYFTWAVLKAHTRNTAGRVTLRSADPRDVPDICFHYFAEGNDATGGDLEAVVDGILFARSIMRRAGLLLEPKELVPGPAVKTRDEIRDFVRREAWGHHASCSNKLGPRSDPMAVVDGDFRVHGTRRLRVVDASVFPHIPGYFIVTAVYMISEKAADVILADAAKTPAAPAPQPS